MALANTDGELRKTNKAAHARELEKNVSAAEETPSPSATITGVMGLVQKLNRSNETSGHVAELAFTNILMMGDKAREFILSMMSSASPQSNKLNESPEMPTTLSNTRS